MERQDAKTNRPAGPRRDGPRRDGPRRDNNRRSASNEPEMQERLVAINRVSKTVKGGRVMKFSALMVVGDGKGTVGFGMGKASEVPDAIRKGIEDAKKNLKKISMKGTTIPHEVIGKFGAGEVLLKPACSGTGIIAGGPVRAIMEAGGVTDVLSKSIGASSQYNVVKATFDCFSKMMDPRTIAKNRGKSLKELWG